MGFGAFSSDSTSKQSSTSVSDQGQFNKKSKVVQSQGSLTDFSKLKIGKGGSLTINAGTSGADLQSLLGNVTTATAGQISALSAGNTEQLNKLTDLLAQKAKVEAKAVSDTTDAAAGNPKTFAWVAVVAILAFAVYAWKKF